MTETIVTAKSYDEAVTNALIELQTTSDSVDIEVLEKGSEGFLGVLGGKPWKLKVSLKGTQALDPEKVSEAVTANIETEAVVEEASARMAEAVKAAAEIRSEAVNTPAPIRVNVENVADVKVVKPAKVIEDADELIEKAEKFLNDIFSVMEMKVDINSSINQELGELNIVLSGDDMGVLIGKRGQTLDSLQYLVSLAVNKKHDGYIRVRLDTENYRQRRQAKLEELAKNIARKVKKSRKSVELEPMNPYERRIIHSALQGDPYVTTVSEGEEPYRHVVVVMKKGGGKGKKH